MPKYARKRMSQSPESVPESSQFINSESTEIQQEEQSASSSQDWDARTDPLECNACQRLFSSVSAMAKHKCKNYKCEFCVNRFLTVQQLNQHEQIVHRNNMSFIESNDDAPFIANNFKYYKCMICNAGLGRHSIRRHFIRYHASKIQSCPECNRECPNTIALKSHLFRIHNIVLTDDKLKFDYQKKFRPITKKEFELICMKRGRPRKSGPIIGRLPDAVGDSPYRCQNCQKCYATQEILDYHEYAVHVEPIDTFQDDSYLSQHIVSSTAEMVLVEDSPDYIEQREEEQDGIQNESVKMLDTIARLMNRFISNVTEATPEEMRRLARVQSELLALCNGRNL